MSILQYCVQLSNSKMPNPRGPLSRAIPSPAITAANKEIKQLTAKSSKRGPYHRYTAKERADIGMYALQNGVQVARQVQMTTENGDQQKHSTIIQEAIQNEIGRIACSGRKRIRRR